MIEPPFLTTSLGSLTLKNPFILASGPPTASGEMIRRAFRAGWGGAVIKTIRPDGMDIRDLSPRFAAWKNQKGDLLGFENFELLSKNSVSYWVDEIAAIKREHPDQILIASIMGDTDPASWQDLSSRIQEAGADALELNFSCPHGMPDIGIGSIIGQNPSMVRELTRIVASVADIPVFIKLTPNITDISPAAQAAADGGADGISAINSIQSILGVDIETFDPFPAVCGYSTSGGYSGHAVKPVGLKMVSQIAQTVRLPVMGIGGISTWQDAVEYILLGASAIQVCTAVMWNGYGIIREMKTGLSGYLDRKGYHSPDEIRGAALSHLKTHQALDRSVRMYPVLGTRETCTRCGRCITACSDGGYQAMQMSIEGPVVERDVCDGCGLCVLVCSTDSLIAMEKRT